MTDTKQNRLKAIFDEANRKADDKAHETVPKSGYKPKKLPIGFGHNFDSTSRSCSPSCGGNTQQGKRPHAVSYVVKKW